MSTLPTASSTSHQIAGSTDPLSTREQIDVIGRQLVAALAAPLPCSQRGRTDAAEDVGALGRGFEVPRVETIARSARVIDVEAGRDRAMLDREREAMHEMRHAEQAGDGMAGRNASLGAALTGLPNPAVTTAAAGAQPGELVEEPGGQCYVLPWGEFDYAVAVLAAQIRPSLKPGTVITGEPRGGLVLAVSLSHVLDLPFELIPSRERPVVWCDAVIRGGAALRRALAAYREILPVCWLNLQPAAHPIASAWLSDAGVDAPWIALPWER